MDVYWPKKTHEPPWQGQELAKRLFDRKVRIAVRRGIEMMRIRNLRVSGYRSLAAVDIPLDNLTILIGRNNSGKSNILLAVKLLLEGTKRDISESDFFEISEGERVDEISIEATLAGVTKYLPLSAEQHRTKIAKSIENDSLRVKRVIMRSPLNVGKLEIWQPAKEEYGLPTGIEAGLKQILPEVIFIEAFKDPSDEAVAKGSTVLGKLIRLTIEQVATQIKADIGDSFEFAARKLNVYETDGKLVDDRPEDLKRIEARIREHIQAMFEGSDIRLKFALPGVTDLIAGGTVELKDKGPWTPPEGKGQGFQRALYFALLRALVDEMRESSGTEVTRPFILEFEEPEAFLHPGLQQELGDILEAISEANQVMIATHSPLLVSPRRIGSVVILRQETSQETQSYCTRCMIPDLEKLPSSEDKQLSRLLMFSSSSEFLFADCVLVVEGLSDRTLIEASWEVVRKSMQVDGSLTLAVIDAGNKTVVPVWVDCLKAMELSAHGLVDLDFVWRGAGKQLGADAAYSQFVSKFWELAQNNGLSNTNADQKAIAKEKKPEAFELLKTELGDSLQAIRDRLQDQHSIWVLSEGEIDPYFGLSETSKGRYSNMAQRIRNGKVEVPEEIEQIISWTLGTATP